MRILYLDIDSLRPDHLGCYGYHRPTSPNIDRIAQRGVRFNRCFASDVPCLPSRTAMFSGRFGTRTGVLNHGGRAADPRPDGPARATKNTFGQTAWMSCLRRVGYRTATVTSFADRHSAYHFYAGFNDVLNSGRGGMDRADEVAPLALDWLNAHGREERWFLHINLWDPHIPYRTPASFGEPFASEPPPAWLTEEVLERDRAQRVGSFSPQEVCGFGLSHWERHEIPHRHPRQPTQIADRRDLRRMFDGYDTGILYTDNVVGQIMGTLERLGISDDTAILISSDHGENLGELGIYGDHQTADAITARVPMIVAWPGLTEQSGRRATDALCYQFDLAATVVAWVGGDVPADWDAKPLPSGWAAVPDGGREQVFISTAASTCQRAVMSRANQLLIRTDHDGFHLFPRLMLYDLNADPHEQHNLVGAQPDLAQGLEQMLDRWRDATLAGQPDPLQQAIEDGGPFYTWGQLPAYLDRLRATGRVAQADRLATRRRPYG